MPKSELPYSDDYAPVAERLRLFYEHHPRGSILTQLVSKRDGEITFVAFAYRDACDKRPGATGWASERIGDGDVNEVACLENTETSAIGRALANLGFAASKKRPSYEEMMKADRARRRLANRAHATPRAIPTIGPKESTEGAELQARANVAMDLVRRIRIAERLGLASKRAERLVTRVSDAGVSDRDLARIDRALLSWLSRRDETRFRPR